MRNITSKSSYNCGLRCVRIDQHVYIERTGQWRFTPPTHVVTALAAAMEQFIEEGGQPARLTRYNNNCQVLLDGLVKLGFKPFLKSEYISPIIITFLAPQDSHYDFKQFYSHVKAAGFMLYPGKLTAVETFRVGCIGAIGEKEMHQVISAMHFCMQQMNIQIN